MKTISVSEFKKHCLSLIAASCLENQADLVTKDRRLIEWEFVETIW
ncbi:MAG: hypothetical protein WD035_01555 [Balneolaceae bacterium]